MLAHVLLKNGSGFLDQSRIVRPGFQERHALDPSASHEVAAHFPSLTAQLPRLVEPPWRHAAAWHVARPRLPQRRRAANVTPLDGGAYAPHEGRIPFALHRLATAYEQPQLDLAPIRPLAKLDGLCAGIVAAFIAGSVRCSCRGGVRRHLVNTDDDEAGSNSQRFRKDQGAVRAC